MRQLIQGSLLLSVSLALACGGAPPAPANAPAPAATGSAPTAEAAPEKVAGPPEMKWADMTPEQKGHFMAKVVMPRMKTVFQEFDAKQFANFGCDTCHGSEAKAKHFKMPNEQIFVLPSDPAGFGALMKEKPSWLKFMGEKVKPEMAKLLALPEYDVKKMGEQPGTMGCHNCHTSKR